MSGLHARAPPHTKPLPLTQRSFFLRACSRGFDPLGLGKRGEFVQIGVDGQDQNLAQNQKGNVEGQFAADSDSVSAENRLAPYSEVILGSARRCCMPCILLCLPCSFRIYIFSCVLKVSAA